MSRIGNTPIEIPSGVTVNVAGEVVEVKGPKGQLQAPMFKGIEVKVAADEVLVTRKNDDNQTKAFHGLARNLIKNHVLGVTEGYKKTLKLVGTGYRVQAKGAGISMSLGLSHEIEFQPEAGITVKTEGNDTIHVEGIDKQRVGQVAADIRKFRPPERYKGKGIRYEDEIVRIKPGKTVA